MFNSSIPNSNVRKLNNFSIYSDTTNLRDFLFCVLEIADTQLSLCRYNTNFFSTMHTVEGQAVIVMNF